MNASKSWLHLVLSLALSMTPFAEFSVYADAAKCKDATDRIVNQCNNAKGTADLANNLDSAVTGASATGAGQNGSANALAGTTGRSSDNLGQASGYCAGASDRCKNACDVSKPEEKKMVDDCESSTIQVARNLGTSSQQLNNASQQSVKTADATGGGGGGGMGSMMPMLGALAGMAGMMMMAKQQQGQQNQQNQQLQQQYGALQANGSVDCSQPDGYMYADCATYMQQTCANAALTGSAQATAQVVVNGVLTTVPSTTPIATPLTGAQANCPAFNAQFCSSSVTAPYSQSAPLAGGAMAQVNIAGSGAGLGTPYCMNAQASSYCSNPSYASARLQCPSCRQLTANQSPGCMSNPALCMAQNSANQVAAARTSCPDDPIFSNPSSPYLQAGGLNVAQGSLPAVVLPQSLDGSKASAGTLKSGGIITSSISRGPASDVQGKYSQSLFASTSQVIRQRCQAGKLNNCP